MSLLFFFFKQKTAYEMRISDWSSDVCSSDLADATFSQATAQTITHRTGRAEGDLASIATESKTVGTYKDRPINLIGTETMFLRRQNDGWQIVHIHWSSANAK